jgi:hypothetical protein
LGLDFVGPGAICLRVVSPNHDVLPVAPPGNCRGFVDLVSVLYGTGWAWSQFSLMDGCGRWDCRDFIWWSRFLNADFVFIVGHVIIPTAVLSELRILNSSFTAEHRPN